MIARSLALAAILLSAPVSVRAGIFDEVKAATTQPPDAITVRNPTIFLWNAVLASAVGQTERPFGSHLTGGASVTPDAAGERRASLVIVPNEDLRGDFIHWSISRALDQRVGSTLPTVRGCSSEEVATCCPRSPSAECLQAWTFDGPLPELAKLQWMATALDLVALELAPATRRMTISDFRSGNTPSDSIVLVWNYRSRRQPGTLLVTTLSPSTLERLAVTTAMLRTRVLEEFGVPDNRGTLLCRGGRFSSTDSPSSSLQASRGQPSGRRSPEAAGTAVATVEALPAGLAVRMTEQVSADALTPARWQMFLTQERDTSAFAVCFDGAGATSLLRQPQMTRSDTNIFFWSLLYLAGAWSQIGGLSTGETAGPS